MSDKSDFKYYLDHDVVLSLSEVDNSFRLMGLVSPIIEQTFGTFAKEEYINSCKDVDYKKVLAITDKYVNLIDVSNSYPDVLPEYDVEVIIKKRK